MSEEHKALTNIDQFRLLRQVNIARNAEWDPDAKLTTTFRALELACEVGELCNVVKKLERERLGLRGSRVDKHDLVAEIADVMICLDLLCMAFDIDLWAATKAKFNQSSAKLGLTVLL